ncbi:MAG TPA: hypothetical protein VID27_10320, partial [Blastocatellia bacterium]
EVALIDFLDRFLEQLAIAPRLCFFERNFILGLAAAGRKQSRNCGRNQKQLHCFHKSTFGSLQAAFVEIISAQKNRHG